MDLARVFARFPDQQACISHLEAVRWGENPSCPYCGGRKVARKRENHRIGRWNCFECSSSFNVLQGTIFQRTKIPLQKWFLGIALMINAKKSLSSCQLARDLDMHQGSSWYMQQRIRTAMASEEGNLLRGIVEVDETYVGGKPRRKQGKKVPLFKRGRGTTKTPVIGAVERGGKVTAQIAENLSSRRILDFIKSVVDVKETTLMTDQFRGYAIMDRFMERKVINHIERRYVDGEVHTNTIEGFWSLLKRAWRGQHHHYSKRYMPLYISEACWKYNRRGQKTSEVFRGFLSSLVFA